MTNSVSPQNTRLFESFGFQVTTLDSDLTALGEETLHRALSRLYALRPEDFSCVSELFINYGRNRHGGASFLGAILLNSPFGKSGSLEKKQVYDEGLAAIIQEASIENYLMHVIAHEMAHCVQWDTGLLDYYKKLFPDIHTNVLAEWSAEDYRLFLLNDGSRVMKTNGIGEQVPFYDERLDYMKKHFPLAS